MTGIMKGRERGWGCLELWGWLGTAFGLFSQGWSRLDGGIRSSFSSPKHLFCVWVKRWRGEGGREWMLWLNSDWVLGWGRKEWNWSLMDGC